jgi:hypothetical protein
MAVNYHGKKFYNIYPRGQYYKNTMVNYCGNFNPTFSRFKMMQYISAILGYILLYNIGYTYTTVI